MTTTTHTSAEQQDAVLIPLNKLKKSPRNARSTPHTEAAIEALAASIHAKGLLQNLIVEPEVGKDGKETGSYFVTAGEGRRLAQLLRQKRRQIKRTEPIRCVVDATHDARELSLDENITRTPMHPADQFEAFKRLADDQGWGAEEIAARFGVTANVVRQRMRLGAVSPRLMALYRDGELTLEQLMAFAITEDHARQEQVHDRLTASWDRQPYMIRHAMMESHIQANDPRARFAGKAYVAAGGEVIRDLFTEEGQGYYADVELLERLVMEQLEAVAEAVRQEGWSWVEVHRDFPHEHGLRRVRPQRVELPARDRKRLDKLEAEYEELMERYEMGDEPSAGEEARGQAIEAEMQQLHDRQEVYDPEVIARAGVFVTLASEGQASVHRGYIRAQQEQESANDDSEIGSAEPIPFIASRGSSAASDGDNAERPATAGLSEALVRDLTAHRTQALRLVVGDQPEVALTAITHALAAQVFFEMSDVSCLEVQASCTSLGRDAAGIEDSPAGRAAAERHETWAAQMPEDINDLWAFVSGLDAGQRMSLLAHCVAATVYAVKQRWERKAGAHAAADQLAAATSLDMADHWEPTAEGYFSRVSKALILEAVREGKSDEDARLLAPMKKHGMAEAAERKLAGRGWLPALLATSDRNAEPPARAAYLLAKSQA